MDGGAPPPEGRAKYVRTWLLLSPMGAATRSNFVDDCARAQPLARSRASMWGSPGLSTWLPACHEAGGLLTARLSFASHMGVPFLPVRIEADSPRACVSRSPIVLSTPNITL